MWTPLCAAMTEHGLTPEQIGTIRDALRQAKAQFNSYGNHTYDAEYTAILYALGHEPPVDEVAAQELGRDIADREWGAHDPGRDDPVDLDLLLKDLEDETDLDPPPL